MTGDVPNPDRGDQRGSNNSRRADALTELLEETLDPDHSEADALLESGLPLVRDVGEGHDRLIRAASGENLFAVRWLLAHGHPVFNGPGWTPLHAICWHWDYDNEEQNAITRGIVRALLDAGAAVDARSVSGVTPLHEAVTGDGANLVAAELLIQYGADVNAEDHRGNTPLAALYLYNFEYDKVVPFLLRHGANPLIRNKAGKHAIDLAKQMIAGEEPDWRTEQWKDKGGPPCLWKASAEPGDFEHQMLALMENAVRPPH